MRAIVNMMSEKVAGEVGWMAREIRVDKSDATVEDVFRSVTLKDDRGSLYDLVSEEAGLSASYVVFVNGEGLRGAFNWQRPIVDSEQIHVLDLQ